MVTNKAIASQISQIKHFFHCILVVVCPNSSMYLIMSGSDHCLSLGELAPDTTITITITKLSACKLIRVISTFIKR